MASVRMLALLSVLVHQCVADSPDSLGDDGCVGGDCKVESVAANTMMQHLTNKHKHVECMCSSDYPFCFGDDQYCYKSSTSHDWDSNTCAGTCTEDNTDNAGCTCPSDYPFCFNDDHHCYKSSDSNEWDSNTCAGTCTEKHAECTCSSDYPFCFNGDQHCYKSPTSNEFDSNACAGTCTEGAAVAEGAALVGAYAPSDQPASPSSGCSASVENYEVGKVLTFAVQNEWESGLGQVAREYVLYLPTSYKPGEPISLMIVFHGWTEYAMDYMHHHHYKDLAEHRGIAVALLQGVGDCVAGAAGSGCRSKDGSGFPSWNTLLGTADSTSSKSSCDPDGMLHEYGEDHPLCYESCRTKKGQCDTCDWVTCHDDMGFVEEVLGKLQETLCVDRTRIFAQGCSNGGIMAHAAGRQFAGIFAGIGSSCGGKPMKGWEDALFKENGAPMSLIQVTGTKDTVIPVNGHSFPFIYASDDETVSSHAAYDACENTQPETYTTMYEHAGVASPLNLGCEFRGQNCRGGADVVLCHFDGYHEYFQHEGATHNFGVEIQVNFFEAHPLDPQYLTAQSSSKYDHAAV